MKKEVEGRNTCDERVIIIIIRWKERIKAALTEEAERTMETNKGKKEKKNI